MFYVKKHRTTEISHMFRFYSQTAPRVSDTVVGCVGSSWPSALPKSSSRPLAKAPTYLPNGAPRKGV